MSSTRGDLCAGDRATDLAAAWTLLDDAEARSTLMEHYQTSAETWRRAAGWAVMFGVVLADAGLHDKSTMYQMGVDILARLEADMG